MNVGLEDPLLRLEGGSRVRVTARVRETQETRTFDGLPVEARGRAARTTPAPRQRVGVRAGVAGARARRRGPARLRRPCPSEGAAPARLPVAVEIGPGHPAVSVTETRPAEVAIRPAGPGGQP